MEGPEIRYARSGDAHIAYGVAGDGPIDVVFVSGWVLSNFGVPWQGSAAEGGPMSVLFAATYPERTAALVLYSTPVSWFRTDEYPWADTPGGDASLS